METHPTVSWIHEQPYKSTINTKGLGEAYAEFLQSARRGDLPLSVHELLILGYMAFPGNGKAACLRIVDALDKSNQLSEPSIVAWIQQARHEIETISKFYEQQLKESGITQQVARELRILPSATPPGVSFHYKPDPNRQGRRRVRLMHPDDGKKYHQFGPGISIYRYFKSIEPQDTTYLTEGEKKSACLLSRQLDALGMGGCWMWMDGDKSLDQRKKEPDPEKDRKKNVQLHPTIRDHIEKGMRLHGEKYQFVIICDRDVHEKRPVREAYKGLYFAVKKICKNVVMKAPPIGNGIDDYLVQHGGTLKGLEEINPYTLDEGLIANIQGGSPLLDEEFVTCIEENVPQMKLIGSQLFYAGERGGWVKKYKQFRALIGRGNRVELSSSYINDDGNIVDLPSGEVIPELCLAHMNSYEGISDGFQHYPKRENWCYINVPNIEPKRTGALEKFVRKFNLKSDFDYMLLKIAILTIASGRLVPGSRPVFTLIGENPGVGKSTVVRRLGDIFGGAYEPDVLSGKSSNDSLGKAIMNTTLDPNTIAPVIVLLDNIKQNILADGSLEKDITSEVLTGWRLFQGDGRIPNHFTVFITINFGKFGADMLRRIFPIYVMPPTSDENTWAADLRAFIAKNRVAILQDVHYHLACTPVNISGRQLTFAEWWGETACRLYDEDRCKLLLSYLIKERAKLSHDVLDAQLFVSHRLWKKLPGKLFITADALSVFLTKATNRRNINATVANNIAREWCKQDVLPKHGWKWAKSPDRDNAVMGLRRDALETPPRHMQHMVKGKNKVTIVDAVTVEQFFRRNELDALEDSIVEDNGRDRGYWTGMSAQLKR